MSEPFFDLRATHNPNRWFLPLTDTLCVGPPGSLFMFGGVGMAAALLAMERTCGRPVIWATAQYLSYARPPSVVDVDVWVPAHGKYNSQARVIAHVGDKEILTVNAALGQRPSDLSHQWLSMPRVAAPEDCDLSDRWTSRHDDLHSQIEVRAAQGRHGRVDSPQGLSEDGRMILWIRPRRGQAVDSAMLAIMADHVPSGVAHALGLEAGGNSLDNTIRFRRVVPTDWVLCDITIHGVHGGFAHGSMGLFAQDGELMAMASQSMILRIRDRASRQSEAG
jgi:acyl-CoA thioesterase-2